MDWKCTEPGCRQTAVTLMDQKNYGEVTAQKRTVSDSNVISKLKAGHIPGKKKAEIDKNNRLLTIIRANGDRCNVFLERSFL